MKLLKATSALAALSGAALLFATPASASDSSVSIRFNLNSGHVELVDHRPGRYYEQPFWQIRRDLRHRGFRHIRLVRELPRAYVVEAIGPRGADVRMRVSKYNGEILDIRREGRRDWRRGRRGGRF